MREGFTLFQFIPIGGPPAEPLCYVITGTLRCDSL